MNKDKNTEAQARAGIRVNNDTVVKIELYLLDFYAQSKYQEKYGKVSTEVNADIREYSKQEKDISTAKIKHFLISKIAEEENK